MKRTVATVYPETAPGPHETLDNAKCDRCGAAARVLLGFHTYRLTLCGHHWGRHEENMIKGGWEVLADNRPELIER